MCQSDSSLQIRLSRFETRKHRTFQKYSTKDNIFSIISSGKSSKEVEGLADNFWRFALVSIFSSQPEVAKKRWRGKKFSIIFLPKNIYHFLFLSHVSKEFYRWRCWLMKFIFCLGLVWSMDGQKPIHHFPTQVYTEVVDKMMLYVMLLNERLWHFFLQKKTKKILWCQIDFLIICILFWSNHFLIRCQTKVLL